MKENKMNLTIHQKVYLALEKLDLRHGGTEVSEWVTENELDLSICPDCGSKDFTHIPGCGLQNINMNVTPQKK